MSLTGSVEQNKMVSLILKGGHKITQFFKHSVKASKNEKGSTSTGTFYPQGWQVSTRVGDFMVVIRGTLVSLIKKVRIMI